MKLNKQLIWIVVVMAAVALAKGSLLFRQSLLKPNGLEQCFTCRAEDKPWSHSLVTFFGKLKDMLTRAVNHLAASANHHKIT